MGYEHLPPNPGTKLHLKSALLAGVLMAFAPGALAQSMEGTTSYVAHLVFRPLMSTDTAVLGRAASLEPIAAHCGALDVASGDEKSIGGVCVLTDSDGDKIFSIFETRDIDKSQPKMVCNTHIISAGTGKYNGIAESRPFACIDIPPLAGPAVQTAMEISRNTARESK